MPTTASTSIHRHWKQGDDFPFVMRLPGQRAVAMMIPGEWVAVDRSDEVAFRPAAVRWLDRMRALFMRKIEHASPGLVRSLREAMDLTQEQLATRLGVTKMTVSRWERGTMKPSETALHNLVRLRDRAVRRGLQVDGNQR